MISKGMSFIITRYLLLFIVVVSCTPGRASDLPQELKNIGITERLGAQIAIDGLSFRDEEGNSIRLSSYFRKDRPILLALVYYKCPHLCTLVLNGLLDAMKQIEWSTGTQFDLIAVSIDPNETPSMAAEKKKNYLSSYNRPQSERGWHFLTGEESQIRALADQIGFEYKYLPDQKQYAHAAAVFVLTPQGKLSRYLYGTTYKPSNLRLGLLEASNGKIGTAMERVLLFCFHFDPSRNSYTLRMWRIVQFVLLIQVLVGGGLLYRLWNKDKANPKDHGGSY